MSGRVPAYRGPALRFDALRLAVVLREGGRIEENPATENEKNAYIYLRTGLMAPSWPRPALCIYGVILDFGP